MNSQWIDQHYPRIHRAAWLMTGNAVDAEDLAQETFIVALDRWHSFAGNSQPETWLFGILLRLNLHRCRTLGRMKRRLAEYFLRQRTDPAIDPAIAAMEQEWRESVWSEVASLPPSQRAVVVLRFAEQMSYEQIGNVLGCPTNTAKTRVHHAIKKLEHSAVLQQASRTRPLAIASALSQPLTTHYEIESTT